MSNAKFSQECLVCEAETSGPFGIVGNSETVLRLVYAPEMIDPVSGKVLPSVFSRDELVEGVSLLRFDKIDADEIAKQKSGIEDGKVGRTVQKNLYATCGDVRRVPDSALKQAFCVVGDGFPENKGHASARVASAWGKGELKKLRLKLCAAFNVTLS